MIFRLGYLAEREESLEGVRARTLTVCPTERQFLRPERPVPAVPPKMAIVGRVDWDSIVV